ncbi:hypothetical protein HAHE_35350 [Haloferula helveola]|uniref:DUF7939 domain-containing protein n=1 Tax=Haloferula helveola TaxID=490095 RepID=A0ABM7RNT2_9BACT|nr:hypothetical protein HAHE_35350 [Haloferula helveola]
MTAVFSKPLRVLKPLCAVALLLSDAAGAEASARLDVPNPEAWTGQRLPFFIELRADGTFSGAASFDIPQLPGTFVLRVGNPIIGSLTEGNTEYFTQRHEFAVFSQSDGELRLPPITVRFAHKKGYTGPDFEETLTTEPATLNIRRPPKSDSLGLLVTTESLSVEETWDPEPGPTSVGGVFKRTITQRATQLTGIALAPAPVAAPAGIRVYSGEPEVRDRTERGEFRGERRETITYLVQEPGLHTLPEIRYDWWNPKTETLESKTLPSISFTATAPPPPPTPSSPVRYLPWALAGLVIVIGFAFRKRIAIAAIRLRDTVDPPHRRAARAFLSACRRGNAREAAELWPEARRALPDGERNEDLSVAMNDLMRELYGQDTAGPSWDGRGLASAYQAALHTRGPDFQQKALPPLNP